MQSALSMATLLIIFSLVTLVMARAAIREWRLWRRLRKSPVVAATDQDLRNQEPVWPLRSLPWPPPSSDLSMSPRRLRAFARAAAQSKTKARATSEALLVVGGAALGVQIPGAIAAFQAYLQEWGDSGDRLLRESGAVFAIVLETLPNHVSMYVAGSSIFLLVVGFLMRATAADYGRAQEEYESAAQARERTPERMEPLGRRILRRLGL